MGAMSLQMSCRRAQLGDRRLAKEVMPRAGPCGLRSARAAQNSMHRNGLLPPKAPSVPPATRAQKQSRLHAAASASAPATQSLESLEMFAVLDKRGLIRPEVPAGTLATVFAVYDEAKDLQYIGFSRDLKNSLRTVFSRRPEKTHHIRALHLPRLDQTELVGIRAAWFKEGFGPPPGNKLDAEKAAWQQPVEPFTISERGKAAAALETVKELQTRMKLRGCKEVFEANEELLAEGRVDFVPAKQITAEDEARREAEEAEAARAVRECMVIQDGHELKYQIKVHLAYKTNGGMLYDITVTCQDKESVHRVIIGKDYYEPYGLAPEVTLDRTMGFMLSIRQPRHTEGIMLSSQFPINYFAVSEVDQSFPEFNAVFADVGELPGSKAAWYFRRTEDYGYKGENESADDLGRQFALEWV
ncbi:hypothetical protein ACKKBF_B15510 [Auxenochlorella protothecoides x Auxenochlorella symbiontica]